MSVTLGEVRGAWGLVVLLLVLGLIGSPGVVWLGAAPPIAVVSVVLVVHRWSTSVVIALRDVRATSGVRVSIVLLMGAFALAAHVFSVSGALYLLTWAVCVLVVVAVYKGGEALREVIVAGATSTVALIVVLGSLEGVLRTPTLAWKFGIPSERARWVARYERLWERNLFGFRSRHETIARPEGGWRVLALGDSFTWGQGVADSDSTWPVMLERILVERGPGVGVEVVNMGRRGFTTANEAELLRRLGWQFNPDLVVIQFLPNDALPSLPDFQVDGGSLAWLYPTYKLVPWRFRSGAAESSALLALVETRYAALRRGSAHARMLQLYQDTSPGWRAAQAAFEEIADSARERGVPVIVMLFPELEPGSWNADNYPLGGIYERVGRFARELGLEVVDLVPVFAAEGGNWQRWWVAPFDAHPSAAAQALAAEVLADHIMAR
jgi:lysophospholipase L1-like esterase